MKVENVPTHHETMKNDGGTIFRSSMIPIFFSLYYFLNKLCVCACTYSQIQLVVTPWTAARQASLSLGFPRQEYWGGLPFLCPEDLPDPGIEPVSLASPASADGFFTTVPPWKP